MCKGVGTVEAGTFGTDAPAQGIESRTQSKNNLEAATTQRQDLYNVTVSIPIRARSRMEAVRRIEALCRPFCDKAYEAKVREVELMDKASE